MRTLMVALALLCCAKPSGEPYRSAGSFALPPDDYSVRLDTSKGTIVIAVHRDWAPHGADRFHELVASRYFDDSLRGGTGIRSRFLLVCDRDADPVTKEAATQLCAAHPDVVEMRWGPRHDLTLVRPDGYIAGSAGTRDGLHAVETVRSLLERQIGSG